MVDIIGVGKKMDVVCFSDIAFRKHDLHKFRENLLLCFEGGRSWRAILNSRRRTRPIASGSSQCSWNKEGRKQSEDVFDRHVDTGLNFNKMRLIFFLRMLYLILIGLWLMS